MQLGIFSRTYRQIGIDRIFARIAHDGFQAVQLNLASAGLASLPHEWPGSVIAPIVRHASEEHVSICALSGTYNMVHPDETRRRADRVGFANVVRVAQSLRIPLVTLCTGSRDPNGMWRGHPDNQSPEAWTELRKELEFALALADIHGVNLGVEPEPGNVIANAKLARRLLDEVGHPRLKIVMDAANLLPPQSQARQREVVAEAMDLLAEDLALVHTKDVSAAGAAVPPGKGVVDLRNFLQGVVAAGYRGPFVSHNFDESDAPYVSAYLRGVLQGILP